MSDLINRQDAINELYKINPSEDMLFVDAIVDMLENLPEKYVKIYCCGDCIFYNWKEHNCARGAHEVGKPRDTFYQDCPLGLYEEEEDK